MDKGKSLGQMILILSGGFFLTLFAGAILAQHVITLPLGEKAINFSLVIIFAILIAYAIVANCILGRIHKLGQVDELAENGNHGKLTKRPHPALNPNQELGRVYPPVVYCKSTKLK